MTLKCGNENNDALNDLVENYAFQVTLLSSFHKLN